MTNVTNNAVVVTVDDTYRIFMDGDYLGLSDLSEERAATLEVEGYTLHKLIDAKCIICGKATSIGGGGVENLCDRCWEEEERRNDIDSGFEEEDKGGEGMGYPEEEEEELENETKVSCAWHMDVIVLSEGESGAIRNRKDYSLEEAIRLRDELSKAIAEYKNADEGWEKECGIPF